MESSSDGMSPFVAMVVVDSGSKSLSVVAMLLGYFQVEVRKWDSANARKLLFGSICRGGEEFASRPRRYARDSRLDSKFGVCFPNI